MADCTPQTLAGKTALISGSSAGIGAAIAVELSARGANIVLNYPFPELEEEAKNVAAKLKTPWIAVQADLSTVEGPAQLVQAAVIRFGVINILVNNAAVVPHCPTWEVSPEVWDKTFNLNARGTFLLTQAVLPHLPPYKPSSPPSQSGVKGGSRIICIGSGSGRIPQPELLVYSATKGALDSMIKVWAKELPPIYGCTVNGVAPGPVDTETFRRGAGSQLEATKAEFEKETPCEGSLADPEDVAWTVAWLAEDRSKWVNGEYIMVNGGLCMV
ncbi:3-oxoacyl-(Acyl-carrier protein) reductase [Pleurostoma richardsiae]|uniref:3-oxoacyl-(Acyl-carrier protein) reductase n=1 Tax=Pleurostoma richardsiae TaxID=41990 RepID=A0AA38VMZ0_9PEZI|nr:3-oxoacyl-(Acyl-carrier protein) reductase [Pleurostoma richardsiae]